MIGSVLCIPDLLHSFLPGGFPTARRESQAFAEDD